MSGSLASFKTASSRLYIFPLDRCDRRVGHSARRRLAAKVRRVQQWVRGHAFDRPHQAIRRGLFAEMFKHHRAGPERADWIGDSLADDVESRAVNRLEHRREAALRIEIGGR